MNRMDWTDGKTKLFEFLIRNIPDKCIKAQIEGEWAQAIPLEDATAYSNVGSLKRASNDRCLEILIIIIKKLIVCQISTGLIGSIITIISLK